MNREDRTTSPAAPGVDRSDDRSTYGEAGSASYSGDEWADYRTYTADEAAAELVARGVPPDHAPEVVDRYLDGLSCERGWSPQDQWEIDDDDIAVMFADPCRGLTGAEGPPIDSGPTLTAEEAAHELAADGRPLEEARAVVRCYLDDASTRVGTSVRLWGLDEADLAAMRTDPIERARTAAAVLDVASEGLPADTTEAEQADEDGWSR